MPVLARRDHHFRGDFTRFIYTIPLRVRANPLAFLSVYFLFFFDEIRRMFEETNGTSLRVYPEMVLEMQRQHIEGPPEIVNHHLVLNSVNITPDEIQELLWSWVDQFANRLERAMEECPGSGFILTKIISFTIVFLAQRVAQVLGCHIKLPIKMRGRNVIFNPSGKDNGCLIRCLAAYKLKKNKFPWRRIKNRVKSLEFCKHILHIGMM